MGFSCLCLGVGPTIYQTIRETQSSKVKGKGGRLHDRLNFTVLYSPKAMQRDSILVLEFFFLIAEHVALVHGKQHQQRAHPIHRNVFLGYMYFG